MRQRPNAWSFSLISIRLYPRSFVSLFSLINTPYLCNTIPQASESIEIWQLKITPILCGSNENRRSAAYSPTAAWGSSKHSEVRASQITVVQWHVHNKFKCMVRIACTSKKINNTSIMLVAGSTPCFLMWWNSTHPSSPRPEWLHAARTKVASIGWTLACFIAW